MLVHAVPVAASTPVGHEQHVARATIAGIRTAPGEPTIPTVPSIPTTPSGDDTTSGAPGDGQVNLDINVPDLAGSSGKKKPNQSLLVILVLSVLAVAPSLLILLTGFTRIIVVLSLARNAIGLPSIPPNQVLAGLALFLSLFVMSPTLSEVYHEAFQPLMDGKITQEQAYERAVKPIRQFMLRQTRKGELTMFMNASDKKPESVREVPMSTLIPAFVLSELKTGFIIGFVIFIPFVVIDLVVSSALMSMGMFMLPPVMVSLPFKLLLFVMVGGWGLIAGSLITSFR
jgi:flagellar biosynthetic protein FliP